MQLTTSTRLMLTHPRIGRWHEDDDHHHLTKINHYTVAPRLRLRPSLNALVAMLVAMRLERLRPSPNLFFFTSPHSPRPRTPRTASRIRPIGRVSLARENEAGGSCEQKVHIFHVNV